jgi:tetratricopeptide (TPR) repeat protein
MLIVQVCDFGVDGDTHYRLHEPSRHLGRLPGVTAVDCHFYHRALPELAEQADVLIVQFVNDWELLSVCERRRANEQVTVFEANDYFFDLQPWSPIAPRWQDRTVQELYLQLLAAVDGVQTSTEELSRRWLERGARRVAVFRNHLSEIAPLGPIPDRPLTVGWAGSPGHFADWYQLAPLLNRWLNEHPEVHLAVMTNELAQSFIQLPPQSYHFTPFGSLTDYLRFLRTLDIGLAPLLPTDYNRCRSDVKFLEYASQGVAGIYSDLVTYRGSVVPGETGLLAKNAAEMIESLELLRTNVALRHQLRQQAYEYVQRERLLPDHISERLTWYRSLVDGGDVVDGGQCTVNGEKHTLSSSSTVHHSPSTTLLAEAQRDVNYFRLPPQQPERTLMDALAKNNPADATAILARLVEAHPRYLAALQSQGRLLNDRREHRAALAYLERARELAPYGARTWSEIGRALYRLDDEPRARAALEEAIRVNPRYLPGWQYLLRMLMLSKSPDGPRMAERASEIFRSCYPLCLQAAEIYPPAQAVGVLTRLLDRTLPTLTTAERPLALAAFRPVILKTVQAVPLGPEVLELLRRACAAFPESARLANEFGALLYRAGQVDEACQQHARALALRRQAVTYKDEFSLEDAAPWSWQLAEHVEARKK